MGNKEGNHWRSRSWTEHWEGAPRLRWARYLTPAVLNRQPYPYVSLCPSWNSVGYNLVFSKCFSSYSESFLGKGFTLNLDKQKRDSIVGLKLKQSLLGDFSLLRALDGGAFENGFWFQKLISPRQIEENIQSYAMIIQRWALKTFLQHRLIVEILGNAERYERENNYF